MSRDADRTLNDIFAAPHRQAPRIPLDEIPVYESTVFVGMVDAVRRTQRAGALITISVEAEQVPAALKLWGANVPLSFNVSPWEPFREDIYGDDE